MLSTAIPKARVMPAAMLRQRAMHPPRPRPRQGGAIAVVFAVMLVPMLGFCALAIDIGAVHNRGAEMKNLAETIAMSAARNLNGTEGGVDNAMTAAQSIAATFRFRNHSTAISWSATSVRFSNSPDRGGNWMDAAAAKAAPGRIFYVKVDTAEFVDAGTVYPALMQVLSAQFAALNISTDAIAGRTGMAVTPLAICAMSEQPATLRSNGGAYDELVEYGFRRGVGYDLMQLNPTGTTPLSFVVNPLALPGSAGNPADMNSAALEPYVCSGTVGIPRVTGDAIAVTSPFPLAALYQQLNARFDQYGAAACTFNGAPPDYNVKGYDYTKIPATFPWFAAAPSGQTAAKSLAGGRLQTVADLPPAYLATAGIPPADFGPVWTYAKAVKFSAYTAGSPEPAAGYATFDTPAWPVLYGGQVVNKYPSALSSTGTPYKPGSGNNLALPASAHRPGLRDRRVLNVPLLSCATAPASSARVLAIGRFFMTVPATPSMLAAEFAGVIPLERIEGYVGLFP